MAAKRDDWKWKLGARPPIIQDHSTVKLDLLGRYLREYLRIVGGNRRVTAISN